LKGEVTDADRFAMKEAMDALAKLLAPFTPHIAEELWQSLRGERGHDEVVVASAWPQFDAELAKEEELEIPVQLNGKLIARVMVAADVSDEAMKEAALASDRVQAKLEGRTVVKTIVVPKRLVNVVAK
jgi:leucyl-tRNA synthetase